MSVPSPPTSHLAICLGHVSQGWHQAPSLGSWAALGSVSKQVRMRIDRRAHLKVLYKTAAEEQMSAKVEPAAIAALAAHPPWKDILSTEVQQWRIEAAAAAGAGPELLTHVVGGLSQLGSSRLYFDRVIRGGPVVVLTLLRMGLEVNARDPCSRTLLDIASESGNTPIVQLLIDHKADPTLRGVGAKNPTPLCLAAFHDHVDTLQVLTRSLLANDPADVQDAHRENTVTEDREFKVRVVRDEFGSAGFGLTNSMRIGKVRIARPELSPMKVSDLIQAVNDVPVDNVTAFRELAQDVPEFTVTLIRRGHRISFPPGAETGFNELGRALFFASERGCLASMQVILNAKCNVDAVHQTQKVTPLMQASSNGREDAVELLIRHGASLDARQANGFTALHCASAAGHQKAAHSLVTNGADLEYRTTTKGGGFTPLMIAIKEGHNQLVQTLLEASASVLVVDSKNRTPLDLAVMMEREVSVRYLLDAKAQVSAFCVDAAPRSRQEGIRSLLFEALERSGQTELCWRIYADRASLLLDTSSVSEPMGDRVSLFYADRASVVPAKTGNGLLINN